MKSVIVEKGEKYYTFLGKVFHAIENKQKGFNWLITDCVCYPQNKEVDKLLTQEYVWISGEELTKVIEDEDFQFIWGVFSGFTKEVTLENVLAYDLPYADGYEGFWKDEVTIQHPLAEIEIVAWDSSLTIFISADEDLVSKFMEAYPLAKELSLLNIRNNAEIREVEEILIAILNEKGISITDNRLNYKYKVWRRLRNKHKRPFSNTEIRKCINKVLRQYSCRDV